jgi:hypothetical protein
LIVSLKGKYTSIFALTIIEIAPRTYKRIVYEFRCTLDMAQ